MKFPKVYLHVFSWLRKMIDDLVENRAQKQDENILISERFHPCTSTEGTKSDGSHIPAVPAGVERPHSFSCLVTFICALKVFLKSSVLYYL